MYSKAKINGHPIHPMLVAFPITFYTLSFVAFIVYQFTVSDMFWYRLAVFSTYAGVVMAILAAIPGFIDWAAGIPKETAAKRRGLLHMALNVGALLLFAISGYRLMGSWDSPVSSTPSLVLSFFGVGLTMAGGFHGWELISRHKVGVDLTPEQERLEQNRPSEQVSEGMTTRPSPV